MDATGERINILLVNDRPAQLLSWQAILADLDQNLVLARSGVEALDRLLVQDFAAILLDVNMPGMDGFETAALIRQRPRSEYTPILFVTAINTQDHDRSRGYALGAVDYIFTPVVPEILRAKVSVFADLYKKNRKIAAQAAQLAELNHVLEKQISSIRNLNTELTSTNTTLLAETAERRRAEAKLRRAHAKLEERVEKRTAELARANAELKREIAERQEAERRREVQYAVTRTMAEAVTLTEAAPQILRAICHGLGWDMGELWLVEPEVDALTRTCTWYDPALGSLLVEADGVIVDRPGGSLANSQPVWIPDVQAEPSTPFGPTPVPEPMRAALSLPIADTDAPCGLMNFFSREVRPRDADLLQMLDSLASQVGQFIKRKRAEKALRLSSEAERLAREAAERAADRTARLQAATAALSQAISPAQVTDVIVQQVALAFNPVGIALALVTHERSALQFVQIAGYPPGWLNPSQTVPLSAAAPIAEVVRTGQPIWLESHSAFDDWYPYLADERRRLGYEAYLAIPLMIDQHALGGLILECAECRPFEAPDQELLLTLGQQCAQALERAQFYAEAQALNNELERRIQLRTAELQTANAELTDSREQLRRLTAHVQALREEERARIAREVHDDLGGSLTSLKMDLHRLRQSLNADEQRLLPRLQDLSQSIDQIIHSVRRIATELRPAMLDDLGLAAAIEWQLQEFEQRSGIRSQLHLAVDNLPLAPETATALFRVFQEALTNVARHAQATQVEVTLQEQPDHVVLQVCDNGRGIHPHELKNGKSLGLVSMRERVQLLAGELNIYGQPGQGTTVFVKTPLAAIPLQPLSERHPLP